MIDWTCTDPDTGQYGRQLSDHEFEFRQGNVQKVIDLDDYKVSEVEGIINAYGFTFKEAKNNSALNIYSVYGKDTPWIIAECIFESKILV